MRRIGAHVPRDDGYVRAIEHVNEIGGNCGQSYVGPPDEWEVDGIDDPESRRFYALVTALDVQPWIVRGKPLIDLATADDDLGQRSVETVRRELDAAAELGAEYYVVRPGSHVGGDEETGVRTVARRLSGFTVPDDVTLLLENSAGTGPEIGHRIRELAAIVETTDLSDHDLGLSLDTCALYAAGYDVGGREGMEEVLDEVETSVGIENLNCIHLGDSEGTLGCRRDVPAHVGQGEIGEEGLRRFATHQWLRTVPLVVEGPTDGLDRTFRKVKTLTASA